MTEEVQKEINVLLFTLASQRRTTGPIINAELLLNHLDQRDFTIRDTGCVINVQAIPKLLYECSAISTKCNALHLQQMWNLLSQLQGQITLMTKKDANAAQLAAYRLALPFI